MKIRPKKNVSFEKYFVASCYFVSEFFRRRYLDAVDGFRADGLPRVVRIHEVSIFDLVLDSHVLVERELAGERHVDDHPGRPHVQRTVEPLLAEDVRVENLRGQVGRSSDDRFPERLFSDDPRVTEIAEFDLNDVVVVGIVVVVVVVDVF